MLLPEVADADAVGKLVADQRAGRFRQEDLATVPGRADPCRADHVEADVPLVADRRLARVEAHADTHLGALRPGVAREGPLTLDCDTHGVARARERVEERVALGVDLAPIGLPEDLAQEPPVVRHDLAVVVAEPLEEACRALDVGEQKGDGPARKSHGSTVQA